MSDQSPTGSTLCTQRKFINKVAHGVGVSHLPFLDSNHVDLLSVSVADYTSLSGSYTHVLQRRDDVSTFVSPYV